VEEKNTSELDGLEITEEGGGKNLEKSRQVLVKAGRIKCQRPYLVTSLLVGRRRRGVNVRHALIGGRVFFKKGGRGDRRDVFEKGRHSHILRGTGKREGGGRS